MAETEKLDDWLENIKGSVCFPHSFQVIFPRTSELCPNCNEAIKRISSKMSEQFGGTTEWNGDGCWVDDKGNKICEPVKIIQSAHNCTDLSKAKALVDTIKQAGIDTKQQTIAVKGTNKFFIIPPKYM